MGSGHDGKRRHFLQRRLTRRSDRSVLVDDKVITTKIKKGFFDSVIPALGLSVFCHQGLVVLAGVADPQIGDKAVAVARAVLPILGTRRVKKRSPGPSPSPPSRRGSVQAKEPSFRNSWLPAEIIQGLASALH
ncbi:MAG: hypothetical protein A3I03_06625 [Candidatus Rokubacteria bacterium RIFCSPLOWO2_02_FULL_68_19]|nr:MAG: hypothetical protein A3I03_06625 [Candidatus Rokubacteria bacterium RIFCSPLOWO2_02_FULL_68_19]